MYTNWIVKHGCRTLLKKGNYKVLSIFGYQDSISIEIDEFRLEEKVISLGEAITFSFTAFAKANGKTNRKIFRITETEWNKNEKKVYTKKHSFVEMSTRKQYPGTHSITLIVNGTKRCKGKFELVI